MQKNDNNNSSVIYFKRKTSLSSQTGRFTEKNFTMFKYLITIKNFFKSSFINSMLLAKNSRINLFIATVMQNQEKNKGEVKKNLLIFTDEEG